MPTKKATKAITPEIVEMPDPPEYALIKAEEPNIVQWFAGLRQFFHTAQALEFGAQADLSQAQKFTVPTNGSQDAQLQAIVRGYSANKKGIEAHWDTITSLFHGLHKRAVAKRKVGVDAYDQAVSIGNRLHNQFVETERRRAAEEEARLRREAEERARQDRERELADLENQRLKAEEASEDLSPRERHYVELVALGWPSVEAAKKAGYKDPLREGNRLALSQKVSDAIQAVLDARAAKQQAEALRRQPVAVEDVSVRPDIKEGGDRTTWGADIIDESAALDHVVATWPAYKHLVQMSPVQVNKLGQSLHEKIDLFPGLRHRRKTGIV